MNLPNKLTALRIILTPFFLASMLIEFPFHYTIATFIFIVASVTDLIDGKIAREKNMITTFGKLCDPLADKLLITAALLAFMKLGICNIWIIMVILAREFLVTSFRVVASSQGVVIAAGFLGKLKTVSQMFFTSVILFTIQIFEHYSFDFKILSVISNVFLGISAILTVVSGLKYIIDGVKVVDISI